VSGIATPSPACSRNSVYTGEARQGDHHRPDAHLPIVSREVFETVQALSRREEPRNGRSEVKSLLAGVCRCGSCGYALDRNVVGGKYLVYSCRGRSAAGLCEAPASAMVDKVDALVEVAVLERLAAYKVERVATDDDLHALHGRIAAARAKREPFENPDYVQALGLPAAMRALARVDEEVEALESELASTVTASDAPFDAQEVADIWPTLSVAERHQVISAMVNTVVISRAPRGTPLAERVGIYWTGDDVPLPKPSRGRGLGNGSEVEAAVAAA
jgi:Recombinase zinc beta ribbon domain